MLKQVIFVVFLVAICGTAFSASSHGKKTLVLVDDLAQLESQSRYFGALKGQGYEMDFFRADDESVKFVEFGKFAYNVLLVLAPRSEDLGVVTIENVLRFIDQGGDVIVAASEKNNYAVREIAANCGADLPEDGAFAIDHFNFVDFGTSEHTILAASARKDIPEVLGNTKFGPVVFEGTGMRLNEKNSLVFPVLTGSETSYVSSLLDDGSSIHVSGKSSVLVAALQARNNARVAISGSLAVFDNKYWDADVPVGKKTVKSGNADFVVELTKWVSHSRGLLRLSDIRHHIVGEEEQKTTYTIREEIEFSCEIEDGMARNGFRLRRTTFRLSS